MSDVGSPQAAAVSAAAETPPVVPDATKSEVQDTTTNGTSNGDAVVNNNEVEAAVAKEVAADDEATPDTTTDKQTEDAPQDKSVTTQEDVEMKDVDNATDAAAPVADASAADAEGINDTPASNKSKAGRRKSVGVPEHKNKKLNKKGSVAKITHLDAKPGDYFLARLKGFPPWPCIICSEDMLPTTLLKARPNTAAREDGSYLPPYADGGPKIKDRTFPIMYLATNEFGWHVNTELTDVDLDTIGDLPVPKKKDLKEAHSIASEKHDLEFFKDMLIAHEESRKADEAAKEAAKEAKEAKKAAKEKRKSHVVVDEDEDVDMHDAAVEDEPAPEVAPKGKKQTKKRKAEEDANTPDRPESGKKPKVTIKVKSNGTETATPKSTKATKDKDASAKPKKSKKEIKETVEAPPKEPELTPEEKRVKKEKEILFLRHKLQKGLLTRDQKPKEEEMKAMSEFVTKLEGYAELEVSIIRATKINKVLKAILKLDSIPKEEEFQFKARSQTLLDKWNKLLANEQDAPAAAALPAATNGISDESKKVDTVKTDGGVSNGVKESTEEGKVEAKQEEEKPETKIDEPALASETTPATTDPDPESKETPKIEETPTVEETAKTTEAIAETEA